MICRYLIALSLIFTGSVFVSAQGRAIQKNAAAQAQPETPNDGSTVDKASFLFGYNLISRLKQQDADFNFEEVLRGLNSAHAGSESGMTTEEQRSVLGAWQKMMRQKMIKKRQDEAAANGKAGEEAMAEFAKQEGAKELEDGVMYIVLKEGDGEIPEKPDRVKINYKGMYTDGEVFDSTLDEGKEPLVNDATRFVPGFSQAIQAMKVGSKWKIFIRGDKAYGMRPANREMGVNRSLIFEVELLEIMPIE